MFPRQLQSLAQQVDISSLIPASLEAELNALRRFLSVAGGHNTVLSGDRAEGLRDGSTARSGPNGLPHGARPTYGYLRRTSGRLTISKWSYLRPAEKPLKRPGWQLVQQAGGFLVLRAGTRSRAVGDVKIPACFCLVFPHAARNAKPPRLPKEVQTVSERPSWESLW